jgi:Putative neutral zinc metallopeptidase
MKTEDRCLYNVKSSRPRRRWPALGVSLLLLLGIWGPGGCATQQSDGDRPGPIPDPVDNGGTCPELSPHIWDGDQACYELEPLALQVVDELRTVWGTEPDLICSYLADDMRMGACGPTLPHNAFYCAGDNTIGWDEMLMSEQYEEWGSFAYVMIIAHEWGHRNQEFTGLFDGVRTPFQNEQHADCQAGVFTAVEESRGLLEMGDVMAAFNSLCASGGASGWFDPTSHGTCEERVEAFANGYSSGAERLDELCSQTPSARIQAMLAICEN